MTPVLSNWARYLKTSKATVTRAFQWLEAHGIVSITKVRVKRTMRLQVRLLLHLRETVMKQIIQRRETAIRVEGVLGSDKGTRIVAGSSPATLEKTMPLRGPVSGAAERVKEKREQSRDKSKKNPPTPLATAHEWVRLLGEYGYLGFDPHSEKHLAHIQKTIRLFDAPTLGAFAKELERRIMLWQNQRPDHLGKAPPHPWAINRTDTLFQAPAAPEPGTEDDYDYGALPPKQNYSGPQAAPPAPTAVDDANVDGQNIPPVLPKKSKGGLLHLFKKPKDAE